MANKNFAVGELVWAKMKGFPYWPAQIQKTKPTMKRPITKKAQHYVLFFGSKNYAWILDKFITHHSDEMISSSRQKKISTKFQKAVDEIIELSKKQLKKSPIGTMENNETKKTAPANAEKKVNKVQKKETKKVIFPKKSVKLQKKKKHLSNEMEMEDFLSFAAKSPEREDDYSSILTNVPLSIATSGAAIIQPYNEDPIIHPSPGLQRGDYVERPRTPVLDFQALSSTLLGRNITTMPLKIGFLGLGMMGRGMVKNLLNSGHNLMIWNRTIEKCEPFLEAGATLGQTPADVVHTCDITFCCVSDPGAVKDIVFGNFGVLKGLENIQAGTRGYVELTSIDPTTSCEIAGAIIGAGGRYLEAPVSGSRQFAEEGILFILASGDHGLFNDCESCFAAIARNAYFLSKIIGSSSKMNLILSMFLGTTYAALAEAMALVERCELSEWNFLEILDLGPLSCPSLLEKAVAMKDNNFSPQIALKNQQKDLDLALSLGDSVEQPMLIATAANELFKHAEHLHYSDHDVAAVVSGAKY